MKRVKTRKNFFPTLLFIILLWSAIAYTVAYIDPGSFWIVLLFFMLFFLAVFLTLAVLFSNSRRGLIAAFCISFFAFLRYLGVGNILNLALISGIGFAIDIYLSRK